MSFELQPTLKGQLLELRPLREADFPALFQVASDPLVWEQHPNFDRYQESVFKEFFQDAMNSGGALLAVDLKTGEAIGSSRYFDYDPVKNEIEIGWSFLARKYWGGTFNGEMKKLMLDHAFKFVNTVYFVIGENNLRSQKAIEKIGGVLRGPVLDRNRKSRLAYEITASGWHNRP